MTSSVYEFLKSLTKLYRLTPLKYPLFTVPWTIGLYYLFKNTKRYIAKQFHSDKHDIKDLRKSLVLLFLSFSIFFNVLSVNLTGIFIDMWNWRYLQILMLGPFIFWAFSIASKYNFDLKNKQRLCIILSTLIFIIFTVKMPKSLNFLDYYPPIVQCIDKHSEEYSLSYGLSDYWNAKKIMLFSKKGIIPVQITPAGDIYHWINNIEWYTYLKKSKNLFIILAGLNENEILKRFGLPDETFECLQSKVIIYKGEKVAKIVNNFIPSES